MIPTEAVQPDQERYQAIIESLTAVKSSQAQLQLLEMYDNATVPGTARGSKTEKSVYDFIYTGAGQRPPRGVQLQERLAAVQIQRSILERELDAWNAQEQAFIASRVVTPAETPSDLEANGVSVDEPF